MFMLLVKIYQSKTSLLKNGITIIKITTLIISLSGFTNFTEQVPAPRDVPKRTEDRNAGIVIPSVDCSPYDIIKHSYDPLSAFMLDPEQGIFIELSTGNFDLKPHKLTFRHPKLGFVTNNAYRFGVSFLENKKSQTMTSFYFAPFEITSPKPEKEVIEIAESWVKFFDSLGWKRAKKDPIYPYGGFPVCPKEKGSCHKRKTYMQWENDGLEMMISVGTHNYFYKAELGLRYEIKIVFLNEKLINKLLNHE